MKIRNIIGCVLLLLCGCNDPVIGRISPGSRIAIIPYLDDSNANLVQKQGWSDGCAMANTREFNPTNVRHLARVELDHNYLDDKEYKNAWRYGFYYCHINRSSFTQSFMRSWNSIGFKGAGVSFKSDG